MRADSTGYAVYIAVLVICVAAALAAVIWGIWQKRQRCDLVSSICEMLDALMDEREPENYHPYEESDTSKVQEKLLRFYERQQDGRQQNEQDKQTIQELVSNISHQVKTPIANIRMFTGILQKHDLPAQKREEFLETMEKQVDKLDFLMQSLIKMSRLETGTFSMYVEERSLYETIAQALNGIWAKAEAKQIQITVDCDAKVSVRHDGKWTAEALENILDNAVKYTPPNGEVHIRVYPWQFYTRVDIEDTGIGIAKEHYHDVFKRFYRAQEAADKEGVGLGLYLARCIIAKQQGYISVSSEVGKGSVFSVFLLN